MKWLRWRAITRHNLWVPQRSEQARQDSRLHVPKPFAGKKSGKYLSKSGRDCCLLAPHSPKLWQARHSAKLVPLWRRKPPRLRLRILRQTRSPRPSSGSSRWAISRNILTYEERVLSGISRLHNADGPFAAGRVLDRVLMFAGQCPDKALTRKSKLSSGK